MSKYYLEIEGAFGEKNFGDDALLMVLHREISKYIPPNQVIVRTKVGAYSSNFEYLCPGSPIYIPGQIRGVTATHRVYGGGTQFFEFAADQNLLQKFKRYGRRIPGIIFRKFVNRIFPSRTPIQNLHYLGIGLGPFKNNVVPQQIADNLNLASSLSVRDSTSSNFLEAMSADYIRGADICFLEDYAGDSFSKSNDTNNVLIIFRDWDFDDSFSDMENTIQNLKKNTRYDYKFALIGKDDNWRKKFDQLGISYYCYEPGPGKIDDFIDHMKSFDVVVSARYHGLIYAALLGIPAIAIELEPKLSVAASDLKLSGSISIKGLHNLANVIEGLDRTLEARKIKATVTEQKILANNMFLDFLGKLKNDKRFN